MIDSALTADQDACLVLEIGMWVRFLGEENPARVARIDRENGTFCVDRGAHAGRDLPGTWVRRTDLLLMPFEA